MNDATLKELKIVVERAVRPVQATMARKRRMREELLAHLRSVFEEEEARHGDEQAALEQAKRRLGDPQALGGELQKAVPWWDQFRSFTERLQYYQPGESLLHFAGKAVLFSYMAYVLALLLSVPTVLLIRGRLNLLGLVTHFHLLLLGSVIAAALSFVQLFLTDRFGRALFGRDSERSLRRAVFSGLASLPILPGVVFLLSWLTEGDAAQSLIFACYVVPVGPVALVLMARQMAKKVRQEEEWATLRIEE